MEKRVTVRLDHKVPKATREIEGLLDAPQVNQNLNMQSYRIEQLRTPVNADDASTKAYVDSKPRGLTKATADNLYLDLGGGSLQGAVHFTNASKITNLCNPQNALDAANKRYVDSKVVLSGGLTQLVADGRYLSKQWVA